MESLASQSYTTSPAPPPPPAWQPPHSVTWQMPPWWPAARGGRGTSWWTASWERLARLILRGQGRRKYNKLFTNFHILALLMMKLTPFLVLSQEQKTQPHQTEMEGSCCTGWPPPPPPPPPSIQGPAPWAHWSAHPMDTPTACVDKRGWTRRYNFIIITIYNDNQCTIYHCFYVYCV